MKGLIRETPKGPSESEENAHRYSTKWQARIFKKIKDDYYLGDDSYEDDDGFIKKGYTVYHKEGPDQYRQVETVSMSPYSNPEGYIEQEIERIINNDKNKITENKRIIGHDPVDPEIAVKGGAGSYPLSVLKRKALGEAKDILADIEDGKFKKAAYNINQLKNTLETIAEAEDEIEKTYFNENTTTVENKLLKRRIPKHLASINKNTANITKYLSTDAEYSSGPADTKTGISKTGDFITPEHDRAYSALKSKAPRLYNFIRYESPVPIDPIMTLQALRYAGSEKQVIKMIKRELDKDTLNLYDKNHPALTENVKKMLKKIILESYKKKKGIDGKACWDGYRYAGTENGKDKCIPVKKRKKTKESSVIKGSKR
jgi:hypothetical protein